MTEERIKSLMKEKGLTVGRLAKRFRKSHTTIHFLIKRQLKSKRLEERLAVALGVPVEELRGNGKVA